LVAAAVVDLMVVVDRMVQMVVQAVAVAQDQLHRVDQVLQDKVRQAVQEQQQQLAAVAVQVQPVAQGLVQLAAQVELEHLILFQVQRLLMPVEVVVHQALQPVQVDQAAVEQVILQQVQALQERPTQAAVAVDHMQVLVIRVEQAGQVL
jgi:hypothetical protein